MINRTFDNDPTFPESFLEYWEEYRSIPAGRPETMLKKMVYFHNTLFPDFAMSECMNCGTRWKKGEDRLDIAYSILKPEYTLTSRIYDEETILVEEAIETRLEGGESLENNLELTTKISSEETIPVEEPVAKRVTKKK